MGLREIKEQARGDLHQQMRVPAIYWTPGGTPYRCHTRVHTKFDALGDMQGTSFNYAERIEKGSRLVFWNTEIASPILVGKGVVGIVDEITGQPTGEAYRLNTSEPPDLQTTTWLVVPVKATEIAALPVP